MIWQTASAKSVAQLLPAPIWRSLSAKSETQQPSHATGKPVTAIRESVAPELATPEEKRFTTLSFSKTMLQYFRECSDKPKLQPLVREPHARLPPHTDGYAQ